MSTQPKKLFLLYHGRFPGEKAASLFAAKSAEAFADLGREVLLVVPRRIAREQHNPYEYYHTKQNYKIVYVPILDLFFIPLLKQVSFFISLSTFSFSSLIYLFFKAHTEDVMYSNETLPLIAASYISPNTVYELHDFPEKKKWFYSYLFSRVKKILVTNRWKLQKLNEYFPQTREKTFLEPNAVDSNEFDINLSREDARKKLEIPISEKIVVYTGHLYTWKGVDILAQAADELSDHSIYFIGGTSEDIKKFKEKYQHVKNIKIIGQRPHSEIPLWQKAADVLVIPNTAHEDISKFYTSPMKLFEYMASRRPIIASDLPSLRDIVSDQEVIFVEPDNAHVLASAIKNSAIQNYNSIDMVEHAYTTVLEHTWLKRAKRILNLIMS